MRALTLLVFSLVLGGCAEKEHSGALCPALCPDQNIPTKDTTLEVSFITTQTVAPFPTLGAEDMLLIAARGDSLDARIVVRFDSLPSRYQVANGDTTTAVITDLDSASLRLRLDATGRKVTAPITLEAYDVDTTAADTNTAAIIALFRPDRLVGTATYDPAALLDTLTIPIDTAFLRTKIVAFQHVRLGVRVTSTASAQVRVFSSSSVDLSPRLYFDPSKDTVTHAGAFRPFSLTPRNIEPLLNDLADYTVLVKGTDPAVTAGQRIMIGGLPARRAYLHFDLPSAIVDSSIVVRATLTLTQVADGGPDAADSVTVYAFPSVARGAIAEPVRAAMLIGRATDSARVIGAGSGTFDIELVRMFRRWRGVKPADQPRIIILTTSTEGSLPIQLRVYDETAAPGLRPRLRITYVPRVDFGLP